MARLSLAITHTLALTEILALPTLNVNVNVNGRGPCRTLNANVNVDVEQHNTNVSYRSLGIHGNKNVHIRRLCVVCVVACICLLSCSFNEFFGLQDRV